MAVCTECGREIKENALFCGYCGKRAMPAPQIIIDGKRNLKMMGILSRFKNSSGFNIGMAVASGAVFIFGLLGSILCIKVLIAAVGLLPDIAAQLMAKIKYIEEGLSLSYLGKEIEFLYVESLNVLLLILSLFYAFAAVFNAYCNIKMYIARKHGEISNVNLMKCYNLLIKTVFISFPVFVGLFLILTVVKIILL